MHRSSPLLACLLALAPAAILFLSPPSAAQVLPEPALLNTRLAGWASPWGADRGVDWGLILYVSERDSGGADLNGDGDDEDIVPVIYDVSRARFTAFDVPIGDARFVDGGLVLLAGKNGPPYQLFTYRRGAAKVEGTGVLAHHLKGGGPRALFWVSEKLAGADLTGDGDATDVDVLHAWDAVDGWHNYGVVVHPGIHSDAPRDRHIFRIDEAATGADMDGDGASDGTPIAFLEPGGILEVASGIPGNPAWLTGHLVLLWVDEDGVDQNGNGYDDNVWYAHDTATGTTTFLGGSVSPLNAEDGERRAVCSQLEFVVGGDQNGDGDDQDQVPVLLDLVAGTATPLPLAVLPGVSRSFFGGSFLAVLVNEQMQGQDLSGDGDLDDEALATVDLATLQIVQTPFEALDVHAFGDHAVFRVYEDYSTGDLNGDGKLFTSVVFVYDHTTTTWTTTPYTSGANLLGLGDLVLFDRTEATVDLNGDGDLDDRFVSGLLLKSGRELGPYGQAAFTPFRAGDYGFVFALSEAAALEDLNGDFDPLDDVVFVLRRR